MKIAFRGEIAVPHADIERNFDFSRGFPRIRIESPHGRRLAVVGGGPSIVDHLEEIRAETDIWAINGACRWLRERGVDSTLLAVDPVPLLAERVSGAKRAILASRCHPSVFEALKDAEVVVFDLAQDAEHGVFVSVSTATAVFQLATDLGYRQTVFYGCEGSFSGQTHAYMDERVLQENRFVVKCDEEEFLTAPDLYLQTEALVPVLRKFPAHFQERSGGMLRAMLQNPDHEIVKVSRGLRDRLEFA